MLGIILWLNDDGQAVLLLNHLILQVDRLYFLDGEVLTDDNAYLDAGLTNAAGMVLVRVMMVLLLVLMFLLDDVILLVVFYPGYDLCLYGLLPPIVDQCLLPNGLHSWLSRQTFKTHTRLLLVRLVWVI